MLVFPTLFAQEAATPPVAESQPEGGLAEVLVTATKHEQNLQKTDISLSVLGQEDLAAQNISDPGQLNALAPGVSLQPSFILLAYIRGLGNYSSQPGVDQTVAYNTDGIYISKPYGMPTILFDLDHIEMLRGPQGTLEGRNATAGSIDLISAKPTDQFAAKASIGYGTYHQINTEAMVNMPLGGGYDLRIAAATAKHDSYFGNGYGDQDVYGVRVRLAGKPIENLDFLLTGEYTGRDEKGQTYSPCPPGSTAAQGCAGVKWDPWAGTLGQGQSDDLVPNTGMNERNMLESSNSAIYATVNYDFGWATLTWVPNYRAWYYKNHQSLSGLFGYAPAVRDRMHSEELRIASDPKQSITWVAGVTYADESEPGEQNYFTTNAGPYMTFCSLNFPCIGHVYYKNDIYHYDYQSEAAYAHIELPLFVHSFRFVGGLRYTHDKKTQSGNTGVVVADAVTGAPILNAVDVSGELSTNKLTYKAGLELDLASDKMLYANVSTGYKAGGVNGVPPGSNIDHTFAPETITAYQGGYKSRWLDGRLQFNTELFFYNYYGYQTSFFAATDTGVLVGATTNSQKARLYGGEIESAFLITPDDQLRLGLTGLSAVYTKFAIPQNGTNLSGEALQNAPKRTLTAEYSHTFRLVGGASLQPHITEHYESGQWVDYRHSAGSYTASHSRVNADLAFNSADGRFHVSAYVNNLFNDDSLLVANAGLSPFQLGEPYPPRTYGMRFTADF
jgi:iron complex outermembrane recepter protein